MIEDPLHGVGARSKGVQATIHAPWTPEQATKVAGMPNPKQRAAVGQHLITMKWRKARRDLPARPPALAQQTTYPALQADWHIPQAIGPAMAELEMTAKAQMMTFVVRIVF